MKPTQEELLTAFSYDPDTGALSRKERCAGRGYRRAGRTAGHRRSDGYVHVQVGEKSYYAHCLIWCLVTGEWPVEQIDHRDLDKSNNRWKNLRQATASQNKGNILPRNALGAKGIEVLPNGKYRARLRKDGRSYHLGCYDDLDDAKAAYAASAKQKFGEFARY